MQSGLCLIWKGYPPHAGSKVERRGGRKVGGLISVWHDETDSTLQTQGFLYNSSRGCQGMELSPSRSRDRGPFGYCYAVVVPHGSRITPLGLCSYKHGQKKK